MMTTLASSTSKRPDWYWTLSEFEQADLKKALWQIVNTLIPYSALWYLMIQSVQLGYPYWMTLLLIILAAGLFARIFIIFHDCTHNSFFSSRQANTLLGYICGILTFTPFTSWQRAHTIHHATAGNLDRRGVGDVPTLTVQEYFAAPRSKQIGYRLLRNPFVLFLLGPLYIFILSPRFPRRGNSPQERLSVYITNLGILAGLLVVSWIADLRTYLIIQLPLLLIAGALGLWLFYVQHQFHTVYWARSDEWDKIEAAMKGSSFYKLPKVLQWFSGNIGFHHIHHLRPRIPNYSLESCYKKIPALQQVKPLTPRQSLKSLHLNLWDEKQKRLIGFREAERLQHETRGTL
jgi:omega-6 fatty acid desaturase (delta-12 desaturase)